MLRPAGRQPPRRSKPAPEERRAPMVLKGGTAVLVYCQSFNVAFANATLASG